MASNKKHKRKIKSRIIKMDNYLQVKIIIPGENRLKQERLNYYKKNTIESVKYLSKIQCTKDNTVLTTIEGSPWFPNNPFYQFNIPLYNEEETLGIEWITNTGNTFKDSIVIKYFQK